MVTRLLFAFGLLFLFIQPVMSQIDAQMDTLLRDFNDPNAPGAAVTVIHDGKTVFAKGYGLADVAAKIPCATNTNFRLASVTKQFTAMAVLILAERGQLSLDDKLTKFFPEFPDYGKNITLRQVLSHTSGLIDYEDVIPPGTTIPVSDRNVLLLLRQQNKTYFTPGSEFRYSNSGYALLTLVVENVSGQTFAAFVRQNIFQPLGMTNSLAYEAGLSAIPHRAYGYAKTDHGFTPSDQSVTSAVLGDGGVYSSVADLAKWDQALYSEKLVSRKILDDAFTIHSAKSDFVGSGYGYGWYISEYRGVKKIWHYGSTCGFSTKIERFPEKKLTVILLTNRRDAHIDAIPEKIADLYW